MCHPPDVGWTAGVTSSSVPKKTLLTAQSLVENLKVPFWGPFYLFCVLFKLKLLKGNYDFLNPGCEICDLVDVRSLPMHC